MFLNYYSSDVVSVFESSGAGSPPLAIAVKLPKLNMAINKALNNRFMESLPNS